MTTQDFNQAELIRQVARAEIQVLDEIRAATLEQHTDMFKWLVASLLTINGAAAVAIINAHELSAIHRVWAGAAFVAGIFFAMFVAVVAQILSAKYLNPLQKLKAYWLTAEIDGTRDERLENGLQGDLIKSIELGWIVPTLGWISGLFFALGLVAVAQGILQKDSTKGLRSEVHSKPVVADRLSNDR